jgi:hypothetical protein
MHKDLRVPWIFRSSLWEFVALGDHWMSLAPRSLLVITVRIYRLEIGGKVTLGGLERWFSPRGQDLAFLLSCIGLVRPSSSADLKQNKSKQIYRLAR